MEEKTSIEKILIVDDSTLFRQILREALQARMSSVMISEAVDQEEALGIIPTFHPDLIFVDVRLPDGNGLELTRGIKKLLPHVKVVILTSYDQPEYREAALRFQADHYLPKDVLISLFDFNQILGV